MPEPTDEQVKAAVESYWSELERGGTMSECIRAALVGGMAVTPPP